MSSTSSIPSMHPFSKTMAPPRVVDVAEPNRSTQLSSDDAVLASLGYKSELKRSFSYFAVFGQSFSSIGVVPAIGSSLIFALGAGGSAGFVWSYFVGTLFLIPTALTMGELASAYPTSGGVYFWLAKLVPDRIRPLACWLNGYCNALGYICIFATTVYASAQMLLAMASMGTPTYVPTKYHTYAVYIALTILDCGLCSFASRTLARLQYLYVFLNLAVAAAVIIALPAACPSELRNTASYVFTDFRNLSGWSNAGFAFLLSLLLPTWVLSGFESSATLSEESGGAALSIPLSMISAIVTAGVVGWACIIAIAFTMGTDILSIIGSPLGQPFAQILLSALGTKGGITLMVFVWIVSVTNCAALCTAASREIFAFSRDGAFPFSTYLHHLHRESRVPTRCVWTVCVVSLIIGLLSLANYTAISAIFNLAIVALYASYITPFLARIIWPENFTPGPWYMGQRLSLLSAYIGTAWMGFMFVILLFPSYHNPNAAEMNYAIVVFGFVIMFALGYFYLPRIGGKTFFKGPVRTVEEESIEGVAMEMEGTEGVMPIKKA
ncbi:polyamine transporter tpo5 [Saitoella coloradoensis]